jgi:hypothetical protein
VVEQFVRFAEAVGTCASRSQSVMAARNELLLKESAEVLHKYSLAAHHSTATARV